MNPQIINTQNFKQDTNSKLIEITTNPSKEIITSEKSDFEIKLNKNLMNINESLETIEILLILITAIILLISIIKVLKCCKKAYKIHNNKVIQMHQDTNQHL